MMYMLDFNYIYICWASFNHICDCLSYGFIQIEIQKHMFSFLAFLFYLYEIMNYKWWIFDTSYYGNIYSSSTRIHVHRYTSLYCLDTTLYCLDITLYCLDTTLYCTIYCCTRISIHLVYADIIRTLWNGNSVAALNVIPEQNVNFGLLPFVCKCLNSKNVHFNTATLFSKRLPIPQGWLIVALCFFITTLCRTSLWIIKKQ